MYEGKREHLLKRKCLAFSLVLMLLFGVWSSVSSAADAETGIAEGATVETDSVNPAGASVDTTAPAHRKYIRYNGGDSYTLSLDVTGKYDSETSRQKVDVVLVIDRSNSMVESMGNGDPSQRLQVLKGVVTEGGGLSDSILNNDQLDAKMAVVTYYGGKENDKQWDDAAWLNGQSWTDSKEQLDAVVNGISITGKEADGGTNCQAGLRTGKEVLASARADARKIMIFLSDGLPTFRYGESGYTEGDGQHDWDGKNAAAAYAEAGTVTGVDQFYTIGFTNNADNDFLSTLAQKVLAISTSRFYSAASADELANVFANITGSLTEYTCRNVKITDTLSEYAQLANPENVNAVLTACRSDGTEVDVTGVGIAVAYDSENRTVTVSFPENYVLEQDVTYTASFEVKPTQQAYDEFAANGGGYGGIVGSVDSDAQGNTTSSGQPGFYTNTDAELTYTFGKEDAPAQTVAYEQRPVLQVDAMTIPVEKVWQNTEESEKQGITVSLFQSGSTEPYQELQLNAENEWKDSFRNVAKGHEYYMEENIPDGFVCAVTGNMNQGFVVTNTKLPSLTVTKEVSGEMGDRTKSFEFTIVLQGKGGDSVDGTYQYKGILVKQEDGTSERGSEKTSAPGDGTLTFVDGKATVHLSHGQGIRIEGLPLGASYTVHEEKIEGDSYRVTYNGNEAESAQGILNQDETVNVVNDKETVPVTGGIDAGGSATDFLPGILIAAVALLVLGCISQLIYRRKRRK